MANVILGLLLIRAMSQYDLVKAFEAGVSLFYSASSGSIKRALDGLLERGLVEIASQEEGGRGRKTYRVTAIGEAAFREWMLGDLVGGDMEAAALSRLYFLGHLPAAERPVVLERIQARIESGLAQLERLEAQVAAVDVPDELRDLAVYQRATLAYGLASHRFALDWFTQMHDEVGSREITS
ncbi:PadR family transcriptional regulator [Mobilicoccus caccae]|uniref:PadR family transcriptional regulator n=1 Tax=Mobilicoccus caccae TaxID=1859295 RepID=A0ABQ6IVH1_9MICO|nr:PadR family transcriptional regulator [Mobilicoccus caccae]GMA40732.1 PadR family transcriptional regulator [Mobilicoccus caccae]